MDACEFCNSHEFVFLGTLGVREWYRCRNCGSDLAGELHTREDVVA